MLKRISFDEWLLVDAKNEFDATKVDKVKEIINEVKLSKDDAIKKYTYMYDGVEIDEFKVSEQEIKEAYENCSLDIIADLELAYKNILEFHKQQLPKEFRIEKLENSWVGQKIVAIEKVGIYVPGGTAAYPSTVLMNAAPAKIAGVERIVMITPPNKFGKISPIILVAAKVAGITEIYKVGGAQGIAALAYGTESIRPVNKIVGPGNIYVALAKREVFGSVGIDMIAGPSEILIYADKKTDPRIVASDLLSQAEHDELARPILVCEDYDFVKEIDKALQEQLLSLSRSKIAEKALNLNGYAIMVDSKEEAIIVINTIAPEHLELLVEDAAEVANKITNAGAIFIGKYSPEPLGDYIAGPNHTLPTNGTATFSSALGVYDFIKRISLISFSKKGLEKYKNSIIRIAETEGLDAHANAIKVRFLK